MSHLDPCQTDDQLHRWIVDQTRLIIPRRSVCPHHQAPFEYIRSAYFEPSCDQIVWAPRGGGKTTLAAVATLLDLVHKPGCSVRILGGSLEQSLRMWNALIPLLQDNFASTLPEQRGLSRKVKLDNRSFAAVLTQSQKSVRGLRVQKLRCDEVELFDEEIWSAAQLVTRSAPVLTPEGEPDPSRPIVRGTIEALSTLHRPFGLMQKLIDDAERTGARIVRWCLLDVLQRCPPERDCNTCPLWTECQGVAKTRCEGFFGIDDAIVMKQRVSREVWDCEMLCRRPSTRGAVYPMLSDSLHVRADAPFPLDKACQWSLSIDFGFSAPLVCLWVVKRQEHVYVIDEHVKSAMTIHAHLDEIESRHWPDVKRITCDPAGGGKNEQTALSTIEVLSARGYRVKSRASRIVDGIELVRAALQSASGETRLFIHPRCVYLLRSLRSYRYADDSSEAPLKDGSDHAADALRYFFVNERSSKATSRRY